MKVLKMKKKIIFIKDKHNSPLRRCPNMKLTNQIIGKLKLKNDQVFKTMVNKTKY